MVWNSLVRKQVVIGRSKIVGLHTSLLLQRYHATVSVVHAMTKNPEQVTSGADIVISDVGVPNIVRDCWLKLGAIVSDTGTHSVKVDDGLYSYIWCQQLPGKRTFSKPC
ncbi:Bifunctional protein FolD 1 [Abeliophyllum distichum]|uniref:Bifunctional protein FolD 1 n=1 Tax=Abeliophyllum distichum TaxID=126358 RepID=A0ABD1QU38_9LAMI